MKCDRCNGSGSVCSYCRENEDDCICEPVFYGGRDEPNEYPEIVDCPECDGSGVANGEPDEEEEDEDEQ